MPERQRVVLGREADFETDPRLRGELEFGGSNPRVIEPCAQTTHRVRIADFNAFVLDLNCCPFRGTGGFASGNVEPATRKL